VSTTATRGTIVQHVEPSKAGPLSEDVKTALLQRAMGKKRNRTCGSEFLEDAFVAHGLTDAACLALCGKQKWYCRIVNKRAGDSIDTHFWRWHGLPRALAKEEVCQHVCRTQRPLPSLVLCAVVLQG
jgi:hypothetical protein